MLYDELIKNLISQAYPAGKDVFFCGAPSDIRSTFDDGVKTLFLLPGAFFFPGEDDFSDVKCTPASFDILKCLHTVFADIRFMADEAFRRALTVNGFSRIALLFPECADIEQYGYRQSYSWVGEYRAERKDFVQIAGFMSPYYKDTEMLGAYFGGHEAFIVGDDTEGLSFSSFEAVSPTAKLYAAAASAEKYAFDRTVIYFNSRQEAGCFRRLLSARGTDSLYFDGALTKAERDNTLAEFMLGDKNLLVATKSYIPSSFFCPPERVIFCGVPFSSSHLYRASCACTRHEPTVIYCEDDFVRNEKIISSFSDALGNMEISEKRLKGLNDIKNLLKSNQ